MASTMKISQLIRKLQAIKREVGDIEVYMSEDSEGNGYGTIDNTSFGFSNGKLAIYPYVDHIDYTEVFGDN